MSITKRTIHHIESTADRLGIPSADAWKLRRAAMTLHRWYEQECGDTSASGYSRCIERDENTGKPFMAVYPPMGGNRKYPIRDMERGAMRRVQTICAVHGLYYYLQTDPRGGVLYLSKNEPLDDSTYSSRGVFLA